MDFVLAKDSRIRERIDASNANETDQLGQLRLIIGSDERYRSLMVFSAKGVPRPIVVKGQLDDEASLFLLKKRIQQEWKVA